MGRFHFRLKAVLRLREAVRDERRGELATVERAADEITLQLAALQQELAAVRAQQAVATGPVEISRLREAQRYELFLRNEIAHTERQQAMVGAEVERRRQLLVEADREVRALEKLRDEQCHRWHGDEQRRDVKALDEVARRREAG